MTSEQSRKPRILIVDDHELVRRGIESLVRNENIGDVCGEAVNGREAVQKVEELHPDVVILDVSMPIMGGLEAARQIRNLAPSTKVVIVTMHNSSQIEKEAKGCGADALVIKSEVAAHLAEAIRKLY